VSRIQLGSESAFQEGAVRVVEVSGRRIAIGRVQGNLYAFDDICTHDNGPLGQGVLDGYEVECPRHGARFDIRDGRALCLPAIRGIRTYRVVVDNGEAFLEGVEG
jgi:3-phenylpropionate/trans-cinnamate dioxygenase ferredoxin subunit